jgi:hypothetical protein
MKSMSEDMVEQATTAWFESLGYLIQFGPTIAPARWKKMYNRLMSYYPK